MKLVQFLGGSGIRGYDSALVCGCRKGIRKIIPSDGIENNLKATSGRSSVDIRLQLLFEIVDCFIRTDRDRGPDRAHPQGSFPVAGSPQSKS